MTRFAINLVILFAGALLELTSSEINNTKRCLVGENCTPNSLVRESCSCAEGSFCNTVSKVCECLEGFSLILSSGSCVETISECNVDSNSCNCELEDTFWSEAQNKCVAAAESHCSEILGCTEYAICSEYDWKCHCLKGFSQTIDGHCLLGHGSNCTQGIICNPDDKLNCSRGACRCKEGYLWDGSLCLGKVGQDCDLTLTTDIVKPSLCLPSATCIPRNLSEDSDPSQLRIGICQCPPGKVENDAKDACIISKADRMEELRTELFLGVLIISAIF